MARPFGTMSPIEPNPVGNKFAEWLHKARGAANQIPGGFGNFLFGEAPEVIEDWAYGFSPVSGAGQTTQLDPRILDVAGLPLSATGAALGGKALYKGAKKLDEALSPDLDAYGIQSADDIMREGYGIRDFGRRGEYPDHADTLEDIERRIGIEWAK